MAAHDDVGLTICLTGPESTGKTTLALALAVRLGARVVPEFAREYLAGRDGYRREDLLEIARGQVTAERAARAGHAGLLLCDTDLLVLRIWWSEKYGPTPHALDDLPAVRAMRAYLLLAPDVAWSPDPMRENPNDRDRLYALHRAELERAGYPYRIVRGEGPERLACAVRALKSLGEELQRGAGRGRVSPEPDRG